MPSSNPEPDYDPLSDDELHESLVQARHGLALNERSIEVMHKLQHDWTAYRKQCSAGIATGASPVSLLKLEALASIAALSDFHCHMAHCLMEDGSAEEAHGWSVEEGYLNAAFTLLAQIDTESF